MMTDSHSDNYADENRSEEEKSQQMTPPEEVSEEPGTLSGERTDDDDDARDMRDLCCVVGIGASAGGLQALNTFFESMPANTGMAFVIVQHLDPDHETLLPELLEKRTDMSVRLASEGVVIQPNVVYVIPPDRILTISDNELHTQTFEKPRGYRAPIDSFFHSLAHDRTANAIAVVLSGNGSDGTLGLKEVKELGGMTLAQDPATAQYGSMPHSAIQTGLVDFVLPPEEMAEKIGSYDASQFMRIGGEDGPDAGLKDHIGAIISILRRVTGHDFKSYKRSTLARRIQRRIHMLHVADAETYVQLLQRDPSEVENLFRDFLISVTHFFRDPEAFQTLAIDVIPALMENNEEAGHSTIRVWIPGCATGEEAYSIGMLFLEYCRKKEVHREIKIFATDIDLDALEIARRGVYPEGIADQVQDDLLERYFAKKGHHYRVRKSLRDVIIFSPHNLVKDPPFSRLDLISCRNLLIYLESEEQKRLMNVMHYALRNQGILFLGSSENAAAHSNLFRTVSKKHRIFRQKEAVIGLPATYASETRPLESYQFHRPMQRHSTEGRGEEGRHVVERIVLREYAPTYVVIDESRQVLFSSGQTSRYLALPEGNITTNIVDMARRGLRLDLRAALHEAYRSKELVVKSPVLLEFPDGEIRQIRITVRPITEVEDEELVMLVLFSDIGPFSAPAADDTLPVGDDHPAVLQLEEELRSTREQLQTTIEELETTNEELKSSNEELLSMNEELQSSNEELQTSKEEIQSINEELYTVNAELNQKIEELNNANSDLQNLLQSTQIPTVFVGSEMEIKRFTPEAADLFNLVENDVGRKITDIKTKFDEKELTQEINSVVQTLIPLEREVNVTQSEASYLMRILPYRTVNNVIAGVVITFSDITFVRRAEKGERYLSAMLEYVPEGIMLVDAETRETQLVSREGHRMLGREANYYDGRIGSKFRPGSVLREDGKTPYEFDGSPIARALNGETVRNEKMYFVDGGHELPLLCTAAPIRDDDGNIVAAVATWRDITDLEKIQTNLRKSKERYQAIASELESLYRYMPIGLSVLDENLRYVRINQYLADVHGMSIEDHLGKSPFELVPEIRETVEPIIRKVLETGEPAIELEVRTPNLHVREDDDDAGTGDVSYWYASYFRLVSDEGKTYVVSIVRNITKKREAQLALEESQKELRRLNEDLEERVKKRTEQVRSLSAALAMAERSERRRLSFLLHDDLQQILFGIEMKLKLLQQQLKPGDKGIETDTVLDGLSEVEGTLEQAIQVTRTLSVELNPPLEHNSSVEAALQWIASHMKERHGLEVALDVSEEIHMENVDMRALMVQLVRELLFNVVKHSGALHARITVGEVPEDCISINVEDDGDGFNPDDIAEGEGGGLGLHSIRERVTVVGGNVEISSRPGRGTSITVNMPISP